MAQTRYGARGETVYVVTWTAPDGTRGIEVYDAKGGPSSRAKHKTATQACEELNELGMEEVILNTCQVK